MPILIPILILKLKPILISILILIPILPDEEEVFAESYDDKAEDKAKFSTDVLISDKVSFMVRPNVGSSIC